MKTGRNLELMSVTSQPAGDGVTQRLLKADAGSGRRDLNERLVAAEKAASPLPEGRHCLAQSVMVSMWHKRKVVRSETLKWGQILGIPF